MTSIDQNEIELDGISDSASRAAIAARPRHPMEILLKTHANTGFLKPGEIVEGMILERKGTRMFVDLGALGMGIVYGREYYAAQEMIKALQPGDRISAKIVEIDNEEGYVELSLQEAGREKRWVDLKKMMQSGAPLDLVVQKANTGGLMLELMGIEGFLPASQLSFKNYPRVDGGLKERIFQELQKLVGQTIKVRILDLNPDENKLIFTEKGADQEALKKALEDYKSGDIVEGEITSVVNFGAFMKFGGNGVEGLIHLSEIDWALVENPREILKPGDKVRAKIIDIQGDKVSLSLKQLKEDPWAKIEGKYQKGDIVKGKVTKFNPFGAFVELEPLIQGLAHISEFGAQDQMRKMLAIGQEYEFRIILVDIKDHRISLGLIKEGKEAEMPAKEEQAA